MTDADVKKVVFVTPSLAGPTEPFKASMISSKPVIKGAGWEIDFEHEIGCPYISNARGTALRRALDANPSVVIFIDYDMSWEPLSLLKLLESKAEVAAGVYRFKSDEEVYMGTLLEDASSRPVVNPETGYIRAEYVPAGFLKVSVSAIKKFMVAYPELLYGDPTRYSIDLFNHGAYKGVWYGEDYAFSRRWREMGNILWIIPDLDLTHHSATAAYPGNFHNFLRRQPGGDLSDHPVQPAPLLMRA